VGTAKDPPPPKDSVVRVAGYERALRLQVKSAGGRWDPQRQVWELGYERVAALGLADRIVKHGNGI